MLTSLDFIALALNNKNKSINWPSIINVLLEKTANSSIHQKANFMLFKTFSEIVDFVKKQHKIYIKNLKEMGSLLLSLSSYLLIKYF